jgi:acetyl coenzyme A synthetase (ADP forming)-like protein
MTTRLGITSAGEYALLRDGGQILIRPYLAEDHPAAEDFLNRLSDESRGLRFHSAGARVGTDTVDHATAGYALVAELADRIVALASYYRLRDPERAEMAIAVDDAEQGRGIGTVLFEKLSRDARREGVHRFLALVLASNRNMIDLLRNLGFHLSRTFDHGEIEYDVELREDATYVASADARRHVAAAASLGPVFHPRSIAVVGASRRPGTIGHELFRNLLSAGFGGVAYPVNPSAASVAAVRAYPTVSAIPDQVDLAVVVVPAAAVLATARDCLESKVRGLVVISAGFAEVGPEGRERQDELLRICRAAGVRLIGPNCMGVLVNGPNGPMNATFAPSLPPPGQVAVASQSGALGIAILQEARRLGLGISGFVSMGNKADVSSNDLIEFWEDDPTTGIILLYLESFGNPRRFARVARRVGMRKPIVAVKGGRAAAGQRAAASHTAAMAGSEVAVGALFRQAGVTRCDTLEELFDVATLLSNQPLPEGNRVAVITNAGGLGILCADACEANGLELPELTEATRAGLRALLPAEASVANPVDVLASSPAENYGKVLRCVLDDPSIDAAIVLFIPPLVTNASDVAAALVRACDPPPAKPVLTCFVGCDGTPDVLRGTRSIPSYVYPESAARALGHAAQRAIWLRRPVGQIPAYPEIDRSVARSVVEDALRREEHPWLDHDEIVRLLTAYGIPTPVEIVVHSPEDAADAARRIGQPVALKLVSRTIVHKSDVGGVRLNLRAPEAAADAYVAMANGLAERGLANQLDGVLVQEMASAGTECLVGVVTDPTFGPLIAFGLGGVAAEVIGDVSFRLHPLTDLDADELIAASRASRLMTGFRGAPPSDVPALRDLLLRLSRLVDDVPELAELDFNPVIVREAGHGALVVDARIQLSRPG